MPGTIRAKRRCLAGVHHRQTFGKVPGARQREELPRIRKDDREEARDQAGQADVVDDLCHRRFAERFNKRIARCAHGLGAAGTGHQNKDGRGGDQQHPHRCDDAPRHVPSRVLGFLGGKRHALYGEEEPDREWHCRPDTDVSERQERRGACSVSRCDVGQIRCIEAADGRDGEDQQACQRDGGDDEHDLERFADPGEVDADEQHVDRQVHPPSIGDSEQSERLHVCADERGDGGRRDRVLDQNRRPRGESAPRTERAASERIAAAGSWKRRGHLGHTQHHGEVHAGYQDGGYQQPSEAALCEPEVPPRIVTGDHITDAEPREQEPARRALLEGSLREIVLGFGAGVHAARLEGGRESVGVSRSSTRAPGRPCACRQR